jgi:hypothetical protein
MKNLPQPNVSPTNLLKLVFIFCYFYLFCLFFSSFFFLGFWRSDLYPSIILYHPRVSPPLSPIYSFPPYSLRPMCVPYAPPLPLIFYNRFWFPGSLPKSPFNPSKFSDPVSMLQQNLFLLGFCLTALKRGPSASVYREMIFFTSLIHLMYISYLNQSLNL